MSSSIAVKTLAEAQGLLSELRVYDDMKKKLWKRWVALFHRKLSGKHLCRVEYHTSLWREEALRQALMLYKKVFSQELWADDITLVENTSLWGGMKIYFDDSLLDMSYKRVEKKFQK